MGITNIANQKTPGRPVEITFAPETGIPSANQTLVLIGHAATGTTGTNTIVQINNGGDPVAGPAEAATKFGAGSELTKMVTAAINANALAGLPNFPNLKAIPLDSAETAYGPLGTNGVGAALNACNKSEIEFLVSPYDGATDSANRLSLINQAKLMSGAQRVENAQFGTFGVMANQNVSDPSTLFAPDTINFIGVWFRNLTTPVMSNGELAAAAAAVMAGGAIPFNPLDDQTIGGVVPPTNAADQITVGANAESETALNKGWTPLKVKPNGDVAFVRTITSRLSQGGDGIVPVTAYYDVQDHQVLFFWRKTVFTRESQPDFKTRKASLEAAQDLKSELIRLAKAFEDQNMFQAVDQLAKQFIVERSISDRHRFDVLTPVNVIPGLHVIANNVQATTQFDSFSV